MTDILFLSQYYPPEINALTVRASELVEVWAKEGCDVRVLTGFPNHPDGNIHPEYKDKIRQLVYHEDRESHRVIRTWLTALSNDRVGNRFLNYLSFMFSAVLTGLIIRKPEVLVASSPPLTAGLAGWAVSKFKGVPFVLEIRDLWPESIAGTGIMRKGSFFFRMLDKLAEFLYQQADHLVVLTPAFKKHILAKTVVESSKLSVIMNGFNQERFSNAANLPEEFADLFQDRFVVSYIGNFGWAQHLMTVIRAAEEIEGDLPDVVFLLIGDGAERRKLTRYIQDHQLDHVKVFPAQPEFMVPSLIRSSDISLVPLRDEPVFRTVIPSKMFEIMAAGTAMILSGGGQAEAFLEEADCGITVSPEEPEKLAEAVIYLYQHPAQRKAMGDNGKQYAYQNLSREKTGMEYLDTIREVIMRR